MENRHGGDVYRNAVKYDFSVNINPLGVPEKVKAALAAAVEDVTRYPDAQAAELTATVAALEGVLEEWLMFGNGASELFTAVVRAVEPGVVTIPVPSFFGYEHAAKAGKGEIHYVSSLNDIKPDTNLLFLANPNNPTGTVLERETLLERLEFCREHGVTVVLDECFMDFCREDGSLRREVGRFPNLVLVRAFTKIFAVPGVRLGYLLCADEGLRREIGRQLPEWNLSCFAQKAGAACAREETFRAGTAAFVAQRRRELTAGLEALGLEVVGESQVNFLLLRSEKELYGPLLARGFLIRDCRNFRGLGAGYYRVAVKTREENQALLAALREILA